MPISARIRLTMLYLTGFELYSRWVPLYRAVWPLYTSCPFLSAQWRCKKFVLKVMSDHQVVQKFITKKHLSSSIWKSNNDGQIFLLPLFQVHFFINPANYPFSSSSFLFPSPELKALISLVFPSAIATVYRVFLEIQSPVFFFLVTLCPCHLSAWGTVSAGS